MVDLFKKLCRIDIEYHNISSPACYRRRVSLQGSTSADISGMVLIRTYSGLGDSDNIQYGSSAVIRVTAKANTGFTIWIHLLVEPIDVLPNGRWGTIHTTSDGSAVLPFEKEDGDHQLLGRDIQVLGDSNPVLWTE